MKRWKTLLYFLLLNVFVSACTTVAVLLIWDYTHRPAEPVVSSSAAENLITQTVASTPNPAQTQAALATSTPEPVILQNVEAYEVQFGDTLGSIAEEYEVSIEELMQINQLSDPNSLSAGMVIYVPKSRGEAATPSPQLTTRPPSAASTGTSAAPAVEAGVVINSVIGVGEISAEHVFISRTGSGQLSLAGWQIEDQDGNIYVFPQLDLFAGGAVNVWTTAGVSTVVDLYWGLQFPVWERGETVTLRDQQGKVRATYTIP